MEAAIPEEPLRSMAEFLLLIRSGRTAYDLCGRIKGTLDIPLCPEGIGEAHAFADLAVDILAAHATGGVSPGKLLRRLLVSPARCARETAEVVGRRLGMKPRACPGLENLDHGLWQGMRVDEIEERQPRLHRQWLENPWAVSPPEGELLEECCDRVTSALERITRRHVEGGIAVVVPQPLERIIRWVVAAEPVGDLWRPADGDDGVHLLPLTEQWAIRPRPAARSPAGPAARPVAERPVAERRRIPFFNG